MVHDLDDLPLPFSDETFDEILCSDVLEHLEYIPVLRDLHRILKTGGVLEIKVPHFTSINNIIDPTHRKLFSVATFDFFVRDSIYNRNYYFDFAFAKIVETRIMFPVGPVNALLSVYINSNGRRRFNYEKKLLSKIFPADAIIVKLIK